MGKFLLSWLFLSLSFCALSQARQDSITHSLYLIGDAGEPYVTSSILGKVVRASIESSANQATVLFLGDNVYPRGMPAEGEKNRATSEEILQTQVDWVRGLENTNTFFIPGNHDWLRGRKKGWQQITNQQHWLDSLADEKITLLPRDGCPGPVEVPISDEATLIIVDTQWFLHPWDKPDEEGPCDAKTPGDALVLLGDAFNRNAGKRIIMAAHHPLITYGEHGGVFTVKDHLFPLTAAHDNLYIPMPVIGSIYPLFRKFLGDIQDTPHPLYKEMIRGINSVLREHPGSIYVAGHEHALQAIAKDSTYYIVSGSGVKVSHVKKKKFSRFAANTTGFVKADILESGAVCFTFFQVDSDFPDGKIIFRDSLPAVKSIKSSIADSRPDFSNKVVRVNASDQYSVGKGTRKMFGENYRAAWSQEIEVPVIDLVTERGGLTITQKGGGMQTLSLRLEDSTGREYVLRSIEKFPEKAVPEMFQKTFIQDLVQDQISAAHPYAAIVIPPLADAAGIYHTNPKIVFIPDDPKLGIYREAFANTLALYEERPAGDWSDKAFFGNSEDIVNTSKVLEKQLKDNENRADQSFVLRSRLFDLWISDWDRHDDQWRWAKFEMKDGERYRPVPRDRDQAFFVNEGFISKLWSRKWAMPKFEGFGEEIRWPSGLSYNARYFDRTFLTELEKEEWISIAKDLQQRLTDEVIESSIRAWPKEIFDLHGAEVIRKLKARRSRLVEYAISHYEFLAKEVDVVGSNKGEWFEITRLPAGNVNVKMSNINKQGEKGKKQYEREFQKAETRFINIFAMGGDDRIELNGEAKKSITVRVIGGDGTDSLMDKSTVKGLGKKTLFYDTRPAPEVVSKGETADRTSSDPSVNTYDRKAFKYDRLAPLIIGNYNPDDGLFIGGGFYFQKEGFRKVPFKSRHIGLASFAPRTNSYNFLYRGDFTDVIGKWGIEVNADLKAPNYVNNFFGMGNESVYNSDIDDDAQFDLDNSIDYYRFRFEEFRFEANLTRNIGSFGRLEIGPAYQHVEIEDPDGPRYIDEFAEELPYNLYEESNNYLGINWSVTIDKKNHQQTPSRGITFNLAGRNMAGPDSRSSDFSSYDGSLSFYQSFSAPARVVFAARVGAGLNTGDYEFYQAQILDGKTELRGFRKTRFYGDKKFYTNLEMRVKLFRIRTYLFPASLGIVAFHDFGRVWYKDGQGVDPSTPSGRSNAWHKGWGGGIWFTPFNLTVLSLEAAHSNEGNLGYVRLGFLF